MLPEKDSQFWPDVIQRADELKFVAVPTRMLMMRVKLMMKNSSPSSMKEAVEIIHNYFSKNELTVLEDIELLDRLIRETK